MAVNKNTEVITLDKVDVNKLPELVNLKKATQKVIKENPYIAITDNKTYEQAKKNRTTLKSHRTSYQNKDKNFASTLAGMRKFIGNLIKSDVIDLIEPVEDKQQEEITRYENIKENEKREREEAAQRRAEEIQETINGHETILNELLDAMTYETIEETKKQVDEIFGKHKGTFEEFDVIFDKVISNAENRFEELEASLTEAKNQAEENRKQGLLNQIAAKRNAVNQLLLEADFDTVENILPAVTNLFTDAADFTEFKTEYADAKKDCFDLANARINKINQDEADRLELVELRTTKILNERHKVLSDAGFVETEGIYELNGCKYPVDTMVSDDEETFNAQVDFAIKDCVSPSGDEKEPEVKAETLGNTNGISENDALNGINQTIENIEKVLDQDLISNFELSDPATAIMQEGYELARAQQLAKFGLSFDFKSTYSGCNFYIDLLDIKTYDNEKWQKLINQVSQVVNRTPQVLKNVDFLPLIEMAKNYVEELQKPAEEQQIGDMKAYMYEQAMTCIFGEDVWPYIKNKVK